MAKDTASRDFHKQFFRLIFIVKDHMHDLVQEAESGLTTLQIMTLRTLVEEGELTPLQLCKLLNKDKAQMTRLVSDLMNKGLITKHDNPNDKRSFILRPSAKVDNIIKEFMKTEHRLILDMISGISQRDLKMMNRKFETIFQNLNFKKLNP